MSPRPSTLPARSSRRAPYVAAGLVGIALLADVGFDPAQRHVPLCPLHAVTGLLCPLCGGLRAADALAHLQLRAALHDNVMFVVALPLVALAWVEWAGRARAGRAPRRLGRPAVVAIVVLAVAFTLVRNLPFATALRPG